MPFLNSPTKNRVAWTISQASFWNVFLTYWHHVEKLILSCKKLTFALRYLRNNVQPEIMKEVIWAQVVSKISYASPVWSHRISHVLRARLRPAFFKILQNVVRDFDFKLKRNGLLKTTGQEIIDVTLFKRTSQFLFKLTTTITPTELATTTLSKSYYNERSPDCLSFFDTSRSRFGKACISNAAKTIVERWDFDWLSLTPFEFKSKLALQLTDDNLFLS